MQTDLETVWAWVVTYGAVVGWLFVIRYAIAPRWHRRKHGTFWRRWWKSATGWNVMLFTAAMAVVFTLLAGSEWFGWVLRREFWVGFAFAIDLLITHRLGLLFEDSRRSKPPPLGVPVVQAGRR